LTLVTAGRVGKPHGLDGSFYVEGPRHELPEGAELVLAGGTHRIERRAGRDDRPLIRLAGVDDPGVLRGELLLVEDELGEDEWLASDLVGLIVLGLPAPAAGAGPRTVARVMDAPSCSILELDDGTLVPFISDAIRRIDREAGQVEVNRDFWS
jgi:16S rRNA processing protein RimM